jgi:Uma2 family endonuclease
MPARGKLILREGANALTTQAVQAAEQLGIRLEQVGGLTIWEAHPGYVHQTTIDRIRSGLNKPARRTKQGECACINVADVYVRFPDGSLKRPDIAIFCKPPKVAPDGELVLSVPDAVIEVISKGYEAKDLELAPEFYISQGVRDVVIYNPLTRAIVHATKAGRTALASPAKVSLVCGCKASL